jgi:hypothetical protein
MSLIASNKDQERKVQTVYLYFDIKNHSTSDY